MSRLAQTQVVFSHDNHDDDDDDLHPPCLVQAFVLVWILSHDHIIENMAVIIQHWSYFFCQDENYFQAVEFYAEWTLMPSNVSYQVSIFRGHFLFSLFLRPP